MFTPNNRSENLLLIGISLVTHVLLLFPAIYIVVLVAQLDYSLFAWHPTCLAVGCGLLMTEAVLALSGEALLASRVSRASRIKIHWILHVLGLSLLIIGFAVIVENKKRNNANHFTTDHGKLGLSAVIITLVVALGGVLTLFTGFLSKNISLAAMKLIHGCGGIISIILLLATLLTGIFKTWWPGSVVGREFAASAYVIGGILLLARPLYASLLRIRGLFD